MENSVYYATETEARILFNKLKETIMKRKCKFKPAQQIQRQVCVCKRNVFLYKYKNTYSGVI